MTKPMKVKRGTARRERRTSLGPDKDHPTRMRNAAAIREANAEKSAAQERSTKKKNAREVVKETEE